MLIEIVTTSNSNLKGSNLGTVEDCKDILESIKFAGHCASMSICISKYDLEKVVKKRPDLIILGIKYLLIGQKEKIWLSDFFKLHGINYIGLSKEIFRAVGSFLVLSTKHKKNMKYNLQNRAFSIGVIQISSSKILTSAVEVISSKSSLRLREERITKYETDVLMKVVGLDLVNKLKSVAMDIFKKLSIRNFCCFDIILDEKMELFFIDINLMPNMGLHSSYFSRSFNIDLNISYDELIQFIVDCGISRIPCPNVIKIN